MSNGTPPLLAATAGQLQITLHRDGNQVQRAEILSNRPQHLSRIFEGQTPQQLLQVLPLLFSVCGIAQAHAALSACHAALGITLPPDAERARQMLVWMETVREHSWRIGTDWPAFCGDASEAATTLRALAPLSGLLSGAERALFMDGDAFSFDACARFDRDAIAMLLRQLESLLNSVLFGGALAAWRGIDSPEALDAWVKRSTALPARLLRRISANGWESLGRTEESFLPPLDAAKLQQIFKCWTFEDANAGAPRHSSLETGALHRQRTHPLLQSLLPVFGNGLTLRLVARLMELAELPELLRRTLAEMDSETPATVLPVYRAEGVGVAQVEAARGLLIHGIEMDRGVVRLYRILAPTDWNFAPGGIAERSLEKLYGKDDAELREQAALLIHAIDPCVGYELAIRDA